MPKVLPLEKALPELDTNGYVIEAMTVNQKLKNNVVINNNVYHAWALDVLTAYCRVTVVGYGNAKKYLKLKLEIPHRILIVA